VVYLTVHQADPGATHRTLAQLYCCALALMLLLAVGLLLTAPRLTTALQIASPRPLVLLALLLLGVVPLTFHRALLQARADFGALSLAGLLVAGGRLGFGALLVDGNHLCGLGHTTQTVRFYRDLAVSAQPKQSFDIRYLTDRVNA
jgi:hypothetical protein